MRDRILLCLAHMSGKEQDFIKEAFDQNWVVPLGPNVNGFEKDLEDFVNEIKPEGHLDKKVVALSAGTAAVHLALIACGVGAGDEVLVQSFTFCASSHPITYLGATPVFVDSERESWNMDPDLLEEAIKDRIAKTGRTPKAIIPVALYGMPYRIDGIMEIADRYGIPVIEDAAEGLGSRYRGQVLGTFGKYGVLSFNGNKMITTSGGGALICDNADDKNTIMWYATQARESYPYYQHEAIGYNYRMSNICAGIGRGQMTIIDEHIAHHKHVQELYCELLKDVEGITMHTNPTPPQPSPQGEGAMLRRDIPVSANYELLKENALRMRQNPTEAESVMWSLLRDKALGAKFRRQHIIGDFIVDFVDLESGLVVEIDGGYHNEPMQKASDEERTEFLKSKGFKVLRFTNENVLHNPDSVLEKIKYQLVTLPCGEGRGGVFDSNFWLCTATLDPELRIKGQENAYKTIITGAVGGAAGVIHAASTATTDCQPNDNVEALRVFLDKANIEARPLWKPMHRQPVYKNAPAYVNGVSEELFKVGICLPAGPWVTDDDVRYIVDSIKEAIEK